MLRVKEARAVPGDRDCPSDRGLSLSCPVPVSAARLPLETAGLCFLGIQLLAPGDVAPSPGRGTPASRMGSFGSRRSVG